MPALLVIDAPPGVQFVAPIGPTSHDGAPGIGPRGPPGRSVAPLYILYDTLLI